MKVKEKAAFFNLWLHVNAGVVGMQAYRSLRGVMSSRHRTERGRARSNVTVRACIFAFDPALPRSVLGLLGSYSGSLSGLVVPLMPCIARKIRAYVQQHHYRHAHDKVQDIEPSICGQS